MGNSKQCDLFSEHSFEFNEDSQETGILLTLHNTERCNGHKVRVPFKLFAFNHNGHRLATINNRGQMHVFDFERRRYRRLINSTPNASCLTFAPNANDIAILIGTKDGFVQTIDLATGDKICSQRILAKHIIAIECLPKQTHYFVCHSTTTVAIYHQHAHSKSIRIIQKLLKTTSLKSDRANLAIRRVAMNSFDNRIMIAVLLNDDSVYVYRSDGNATLLINLSLVKHLYPLESRDSNSNAEHNAMQLNNRFESLDHDVCDIAFAIDGSKLWVSDVESRVCIIETEHWHINGQIRIEGQCVRTLVRIPEKLVRVIWENEISSGWLGILNGKGLILLYQYNESKEIHYKVITLHELMTQRDIRISCDGQKLIVGYDSGKLQLLSTELLIRKVLEMQIDGLSARNERIKNYQNSIHQQLANILERRRLLAILNEYAEYPAHYRQIIWRTLLKLPNNTDAYTALLIKGEHKSVASLFEDCSMDGMVYLKKLRKVMSFLMHWSQVLDNSRNELATFLPDFILPFVKLFAPNMLMCFEVIATILLNQCQLWFEYSPLYPINYLGIIENILNVVDPTLLQFYKKHGVTNVTFAWESLKSAFADKLEEWQWLQLWDHIVSQPSYYLIFVVVAFNFVQRKAILHLRNQQQIYTFFQERSGINMKRWLCKANEIMNNCPASIHPDQFMNDSLSLNIDHQYQKILNYPQQLFARQTKHLSTLAAESTAINRKYMELEQLEMNLMQRMVDNIRMNEQHHRMQNVELEHERMLLDEMRRTEMQRQHLVLYERQLYDRAALMAMLLNENEVENACNEREHYLKTTENCVEQQKCKNETNLLAADAMLRKREIDLLLNECNLLGEHFPAN